MPKVTISGKLVDHQDGAPLQGQELVSLQILDRDTRTWGDPKVLNTNADGEWRRQVEEGDVVRVQYVAYVDVAGLPYRLTDRQVICSKVVSDLRVDEVRYRPAGPEIIGVILRESLEDGVLTNDTPFANVPVELRDGSTLIAEAVTDPLGRFSFAPTSGNSLNLLMPSELVDPESRSVMLELNEFIIQVVPGEPFEVPTAIYTLKPAVIVGEVSANGQGLSGLRVLAHHLITKKQLEDQYTDGGSYRFTTVPGPVRLTFPPSHTDEETGQSWELPDLAPSVQTVMASSESVSQARLVYYAPAKHAVEWQTLTPEGVAVGGVLVQVWNEGETEVVAEDRTNDAGLVHLPVPVGGRYTVVVHEDERHPRPPRKYVRDVGSKNYGKTYLSSRPFPDGVGAGGDGRSLPESIVDLAAYPILTSGVPFQGGGVPGQPAGAEMSQTVSTEIRNVLGWRWRGAAPDPAGLTDVLSQSFHLTEEEGHTLATWVPRTYLVQSDLGGGITGAQASIYNRAKVAVDAALPLMEGLYALRIDADPEDSKALKAVVANQARDLLGELGMVGGPRVSRVDQMFRLLLGPSEFQTDPDQIGGELGTLRKEFGLSSDALVNTVDEEQDVTNYRIVADYLTGLRQSWLSNRDFFLRDGTGGKPPFFGTQLVLISRQLAVIGDSVDEVRGIMRSVFISDAERETLEIEFKPQGGEETAPLPMLIEGLLSWVGTFATDEGPTLIQDGGKWAVGQSLVPVARTLTRLVKGALDPANPEDLPAAYFTPRVQRSLSELAAQLDELVELTHRIKHKIPAQE